MKLQLGETRAMVEALQMVMNEVLPVKTAYWLKRAMQQIQPEFEAFEEARKSLVNNYATRDENDMLAIDGDNYVIEDMEGFQKEYEELASTEIEIKYEPLGIDDLGDISITPNVLLKLGRLICDIWIIPGCVNLNDAKIIEPERTFYKNQSCSVVVTAGRRLIIETSPGGADVAEGIVPVGKKWNVTFRIYITEDDV